jgi:hypothetical protein
MEATDAVFPSEAASPSEPAPPCEAHHAHPFEEEEVGLAVEHPVAHMLILVRRRRQRG